MKRQFTATVYITDGTKVLLIYHKKLQKWLPPGGHMDPNETPPEAAKREALEETGIEVELIRQENIWVEEDNAVSFERPYLCLVEEIPPHGCEEAHQHIDFIYLGRPVGGEENHNVGEVEKMHWFSLNEIEKLEDLFLETKNTIKTFLRSPL